MTSSIFDTRENTLKELLRIIGPMRNGDRNYDEAISDVLTKIEHLLENPMAAVLKAVDVEHVEEKLLEYTSFMHKAYYGMDIARLYDAFLRDIPRVEDMLGYPVSIFNKAYRIEIHVHLPKPDFSDIILSINH